MLYTADLLQLIIRRHHLHPHAYADDTQIYGSCHPSEVGMLQQQLSTCVDEVAHWMISNQLNHSKYSGVRLPGASINFRLVRCESGTHL